MHLLLGFSNMTSHQKDIGARGQMREKAAFLDDVTNPTAKGVDVIGRHRFAVERDRTGSRFDQTNDQA